MLRVAKGTQCAWYDMEEPELSDLARLRKEVRIHELVLEDIIPQVRHPKLDLFGSHLFVVLTIPLFERNKKDGRHTVRLEELDMVIGKNWLVTSHYRPIQIVDSLFERVEAERAQKVEYLNTNPATLIYTILSNVLQQSIASLNLIEERVEQAETAIADGMEREMVQELSQLRRDIIDFARALSPARPVFRALDDAAPLLFGQETLPYFRNLTGRIEQIATLLKSLKETVEALEETNHSLLQTHTNDIVRVFTVLTALLLPPSLVTSVFSMNLKYPFQIGTGSFWGINTVALLSVLVPWIIFKKKKWI